MANLREVQDALGIKAGTWSTYISEGTVTKQKQGTYDIYQVAQQIIRDKNTRLKKIAGQNSKINEKYKKLELQLAMLGAQPTSGSGDNAPNFIASPKSEKESIDLQISKQKLIRMKHDNKVRKKEVMPIENVFAFVTNIASEFSAFLDPIVGKIKQSNPDMNAKAHDDLTKTMAVGRNNLSRHIEGKTVDEFISLFNPDGDLGDDDE